jgi:hypothetical protein
MLRSNFGRNIDYFDCFFVIFLSPSRQIPGKTSIKPRPLPSKLRPIHRTTVILPVNAVYSRQSRILRVLLNSSQKRSRGSYMSATNHKEAPLRSRSRHKGKMATDEALTIIRWWGRGHLSKNSIKPVCRRVAFPSYPEQHFQRLPTGEPI